MRQRRGFTLVELLVVIGIIALLVSILLPALSSARRAAGTVKCAAALKEIGNSFLMYAQENKGYAPACRLFGTTVPYNISGIDLQTTTYGNAYWTNFLAKYVTKTKLANAGATAAEAQDQLKSVFWGCPAWTPEVTAVGISGFNQTQFGYGMNGYPEYSADYPPTGKELGEASGAPYDSQVNTPSYVGPGWTAFNNRWYKLSKWQVHGQERALVADCIYWFLESRPPNSIALLQANVGIPNLQNGALGGATWSAADSANQTDTDIYRHGKYPGNKPGAVDEFNPRGGKISYNVLFSDGHVSNLITKDDAYRVVRMRYPG